MPAFPDLVRWSVRVAWIAFGIGMAARSLRGRSGQKEGRKEPRTLAGVALQACAFFALFTLGAPPHRARLAVEGSAGVLLGAAAIVVAALSVWLALAAMAHLGEQWSIRARLLERHALVTDGPYAIVRHPIYSGLLGLLIATGVALGHWVGLAVAVPVYVAGTLIRTRAEERLLRGAFGDAYDAYARRVRALVPFVW